LWKPRSPLKSDGEIVAKNGPYFEQATNQKSGYDGCFGQADCMEGLTDGEGQNYEDSLPSTALCAA